MIYRHWRRKVTLVRPTCCTYRKFSCLQLRFQPCLHCSMSTLLQPYFLVFYILHTGIYYYYYYYYHYYYYYYYYYYYIILQYYYRNHEMLNMTIVIMVVAKMQEGVLLQMAACAALIMQLCIVLLPDKNGDQIECIKLS